MVTLCETVGDASYYRRSGCFYAPEDCPLTDQKDEYGNKLRFFGEQVLDKKDHLQDEIFDFNNPTSFVQGDGHPAKNQTHEQGIHDGHYEGADWITDKPNPGTSPRAEWCKDAGGRLAGIGPSCEIDQRGAGQMHQCVFEMVKECEAIRQACLSNLSYSNLSQSFLGGTIDVAAMPAVRPARCDEAFKNCKEAQMARCICSDCDFGPACLTNCAEDDAPTVVDPTDGEGDALPGLPFTEQKFTSSAYDIPIPFVVGNYITMGNIFWVGEIRTTIATEQVDVVETEGVRSYEQETLVAHGDFALAIAEGPIYGLIRVWFGETLLFSRSVDTVDGTVVDEIENMLLFSANTDDITYYDQTKMSVTLFPGTEDQTAPEVMGVGSPAYRGLAYLLFENVNMSYINGNIPEIRVEVLAESGANEPTMETTLTTARFTGAHDDCFVADVTNDRLYIGADPAPGQPPYAGIRVLRLSNLDELFDITLEGQDIDTSTLQVLTNGMLVFQPTGGGQRETVLYNPDSQREVMRFGTEGGDISDPYHEYDSWGILNRASISFNGYIRGTPYDDAARVKSGNLIAAVTPNGGFRVAYYDPALNRIVDTGYYYESSTAVTNYYECVYDCYDNCYETYCDSLSETCDDVALENCYDGCEPGCLSAPGGGLVPFGSVITDTFYRDETLFADITFKSRNVDVFSLPESGAANVNVRRFQCTDNGDEYSAGTLLLVDSWTSEFLIPASAWGGDTSNISGLFVIDDPVRDSVVVFLRSTSGHAYVFSVSKADNYATVNWSIRVEAFPEFISPGPRMLKYPAKEFMFINTNGDAVSIEVASGFVSTVATAAAEGLTGPQLYDPARESITWLDDSVVRRIYPRRTATDTVSVANIVRAVGRKVGLGEDLLDLTDVEDIAVGGIGIFANTKPRNVLDSLAKMFSLTIWEQDGKVHFSRRGRYATTHTIDYREMVVEGRADDIYERVRTDTFTDAKRLTFTYADIDNFCRPISQSLSQQIAPDTFLGPITHVTYETPITMLPETAIKIAEEMYANLYIAPETLTFSVSAKRGQYVPNDAVRVTFEDGSVQTYILNECEYDGRLGISTVRGSRDISYLTGDAVSIEPYDDPRKYRVQTSFRKLSAYRLRTFMVTPFRPVEMLASKSHHVIYTGVESVDNSLPETLVTKTRVLNGAEPNFTFGANLREPLHLGEIVTPPLDVPYWATDTQSTLVVRFFKAATVALLSSATHREILDDRTRNALLIGKEWIQFANFSVAPDGLTVTFTGLLRGRAGTEQYVGDGHTAGEEVVYPTVDSFAPNYVLFARMPYEEPIAMRLTAPQDIQNSGQPVVFNTTTESVKPWAPGDLSRYDDAYTTDVYFKFAYRGKHDGALEETPTFEPTEATYNRFKDATTGAYTVQYVVWGSTFDYTREQIAERMKAVYEHQDFWYMPLKKVVTNPIVTFTAGEQATGGVDLSTEPFHVYVAQIGGPANRQVGFVTKKTFMPGDYEVLPPQPGARTFKQSAYVVMTPDSFQLLDVEMLVILKP